MGCFGQKSIAKVTEQQPKDSLLAKKNTQPVGVFAVVVVLVHQPRVRFDFLKRRFLARLTAS